MAPGADPARFCGFSYTRGRIDSASPTPAPAQAQCPGRHYNDGEGGPDLPVDADELLNGAVHRLDLGPPNRQSRSRVVGYVGSLHEPGAAAERADGKAPAVVHGPALGLDQQDGVQAVGLQEGGGERWSGEGHGVGGRS